MHISWRAEGLSLGAMLTTLLAHSNLPRVNVTGHKNGKAVEDQLPCLPEVTIPPNGHFTAGGGALSGGNADHAAGVDPSAALACDRP